VVGVLLFVPGGTTKASKQGAFFISKRCQMAHLSPFRKNTTLSYKFKYHQKTTYFSTIFVPCLTGVKKTGILLWEE